MISLCYLCHPCISILSGEGLNKLRFHFNPVDLYCVFNCKLLLNNICLTITRRQNFRLVQLETDCRRHFKVHLKWKIRAI